MARVNEYQIVSLVALLGWLILVAGGLRGRGLHWSKGMRLGMMWVGIFLVVTLFISLVTGK